MGHDDGGHVYSPSEGGDLNTEADWEMIIHSSRQISQMREISVILFAIPFEKPHKRLN
ncbi:hypothetical protein GJ744_010950 [Endocarpon pusillum]|uniref:Uncharacterized protein n=1 Tax=Endocarpon pusillum TaxID=364733 RepID=A0A8H7AFW6_9EURO|nr:hypothetical protein GJ744_010950 [Endocarpon pusillum]